MVYYKFILIFAVTFGWPGREKHKQHTQHESEAVKLTAERFSQSSEIYDYLALSRLVDAESTEQQEGA
jgi:hypothetical protein